MSKKEARTHREDCYQPMRTEAMLVSSLLSTQILEGCPAQSVHLTTAVYIGEIMGDREWEALVPLS